MRFAKMHGLGNDFIVIENMNWELKNLRDIAVSVCDRHFGVGADGLLVVEKSDIADIKMNIINSDGSTAEMCGNGVRCFGKYVYEKGIVKKEKIEVETLAGIMKVGLTLKNSEVERVKVNMGSPRLDKYLIPFSGENNLSYTINIRDKSFNASTLLIGVPHTVIYVDEIDIDEVINAGREIERLDIFPEGTNVNFVKIISREKIEVRTWERGAGATLACGTGTCASAVACFLRGRTENNIEAVLAGGKLYISYDEKNVYMDGPAAFICEGDLNII